MQGTFFTSLIHHSPGSKIPTLPLVDRSSLTSHLLCKYNESYEVMRYKQPMTRGIYLCMRIKKTVKPRAA